MKKFIAILSALVMCCTYTPVYAESVVDPPPNYTGNEKTTVEGSPERWEKFLKYDLCITDYDSLTDDEKDLCRFIFETEQSSTQTIRCERARRTLAHDENIGERLTLETAMDSYGVWDNYSSYKFGRQYFTHCVPDIEYLDNTGHNEYWLDDEGTVSIIANTQNSYKPFEEQKWDSFSVYDYSRTESFYDDNGIYYSATEDLFTQKKYVSATLYFKEYPEENLITVDNITYGLCPDNTLTVIDGSNATGFVEIPESIDNHIVTSINSDAFSQTDICGITFPDTIEFIDSGAFWRCENLKEVNFPENLKYLGSRAFSETGLEELVIDCPELNISGLAFDTTPIKYADINAKNIPSNIFYLCKNLEYVHVGSCVETIEPYAFNECTVKNIRIEDGVKYIGLYAFNTFNLYTNNKLTLNLPDTIEVMGVLPQSTGYVSIGNFDTEAVNNLKKEYTFNFFSNNRLVYVHDNLYNILNPRGKDKTIKNLDTLLYGDLNDDSKVTVADAVILQKYLHGNGETGYEADINNDGYVDIFDMVCMRKMLIK